MKLRARCHLYYRAECDDAYHPSMCVRAHQNMFIFMDSDINTIIEIYRLILPLQKIVRQVSHSQDFAQLAKEKFYDTSLQAQGEAFKTPQ